jgi:hypothetical protein
LTLGLIFFQHGDIQCDIEHGVFEFHFLQGIWEANEGSEISGTILGAPKSGMKATEQDNFTQDKAWGDHLAPNRG